MFTYLNKELKFDRYEQSFLWLKDAGVAIPVYNVQEPVVPLEQSRSSNLFKLFQSDVGLLTSCYPALLRRQIMEADDLTFVNVGPLFENYVACELRAAGQQVLYYKTAKLGEVDFITEVDGQVVPIEVKSGRDYKKHSALDHLLAAPDYRIPQAVVLSPHELEVDGPIFYCPIYMASLIRSSVPDRARLDIHIF